MRRFCEIFKQQINARTTTAAFIAVASVSVGIVLHLGQARIAPRGDNIKTEPMINSIVTKRVGDAFATIATKPLGYVFATEPVGDAITTKPVGIASATKIVSDAVLAKPVGEAIAIKSVDDAIADKPGSDGIVTKPASNANATKPAGGSIATKPVDDAIADKPGSDGIVTKPASDANATKPAGGSIATKPVDDAIANKPGSDAIATKKAVPIPQTTQVNEWQDWQYCLAPSLAEHKVYLSPPIPMIGILGRADAAFHEMLNTAGIPHDEVQCPKAPNKRTLLFRQRHAIRLNEEVGNATVTLNWKPDVD